MSKDKFQEFVPYGQALALKELGFDEPCFGRYDGKGKNKSKIWYEMPNSGQDSIPVGDVLAPTFSQAFRFFREKYKLHSILEYDSDNYYFVIQGVNDFNFIIDISEDGEVYQTYEEAELECLKKLIEIVKEQK